MRFEGIRARALERHGHAVLASRLGRPKAPDDLAATPDDRYLSAMTKVVFASGFRWRVVQSKWPGFEDAFHRFDVGRVASADAEEMASLAADTRIIRNATKIRCTIENAAWVRRVAEENDGFGRWIAGWPADDPVGLWDALKAGGSRLGGNTGPRFLRAMGFDTFLLTEDVAAALAELGLMHGKPTGKGARRQAQQAFNDWRAETGLPLCQLSVILASSRGQIYGA